jgi:hypothetical protein
MMKMRVQWAFRMFTGTVCACAFLILTEAASAQNLFVADYGSSNIYELTPNGAQSTFASGLSNPVGLAFDGAGNLYASEFFAHNIVKFTPSGAESIYASGIDGPTGLAFDPSGDLFVGQGIGSITEISTNGTKSIFASGGGEIFGLAFDKADNLYAADTLRGAVYEFTPNGTMTTYASGLGSPGPTAVAFDSTGNLYVAIASSKSIIEFPAGGTQTNFVSLFNPWGIAFDNFGNMFVAQGALTNGLGGSITEINVDGGTNLFASGFTNLIGLAFQPMPKLDVASIEGTFHLTVSTPSPSPLSPTIVQTSTDLINWSNVYTNVSPFVYTDSVNSGTPYRFYRTVMWP